MNSSDKTKFIIGGCAILAIAFLLTRRANKKSPSAVMPKVTTSISAKPPSTQTQLLTDSDIGQKSGSTESRKKYNRMMMTGLVEVPTTNDSSNLKFKLRPKAKPIWCSTGDFDSIKNLAGKMGVQQFLLSVEPLTGSKTHQPGNRISAFEIFAGKSFDAILPRDANSRDYGVYLCLDTAQTNECASKKVLFSKDWKKLGASKQNKDVLIYFQMITVHNNRVYLLPSEKWNQGTIDGLKVSLKSILQSPESLDMLQHHMNFLQSVPAQINRGMFELILPYRARGC